MSFDQVLAAEAEWFSRADLAGVGPLAKADGGPFDAVGAHVRRLAQAGRQLWLTHGASREVAGSKSTRRLDHEVIALVLWPATGAGARAHVDQAAAGAATQLVADRVHGPDGDVGHGGRWFRVGPVSVEPPGPLDILRYADAIGAAGAAYVIAVRYSVTEMAVR